MAMKNFYLPEFVRCPICGESLTHEGGSLYCVGERRHTYDIAKEGYVNLLPPGRAKNARTGDGADMIKARERFLSSGGYDRYSAEAAVFASGFLTGVKDRLVLVDAGCGEGRHTVNMANVLCEKLRIPVECAGFDASKYGAAAAAKRYVKNMEGQAPFGSYACYPSSLADSRTVSPEDGGLEIPAVRKSFFAGNIFSLPVTDGCADVFCSLFAPLPDEEAVRVLRTGGVLLICAAGSEHLHELREVLYDTPIPSGGGAVVPDGFETVGETVIEYQIELDTSDEIMSLFIMTPFYHNAPAGGRKRLEAKEHMTVTVQVKCTVAVRI